MVKRPMLEKNTDDLHQQHHAKIYTTAVPDRPPRLSRLQQDFTIGSLFFQLKELTFEIQFLTPCLILLKLE